MGAAASIKSIYDDAFDWFKKYFDQDLYVKDFESMDKDHNGAISYPELEKYVKGKSMSEGGSWSFMISNPIIIKIAHAQAVKGSSGKHGIVSQKVIGIADFKNLLIHLFAISILWVHFKNADDWVEGYDFGNLTLSKEEFRLACRTVTASHCNEDMTDEEIDEAFVLLDTNQNGSIAFLEVCEYCCKYINSELERKITEEKARRQQQLEDTLKEHGGGHHHGHGHEHAIDPNLLHEQAELAAINLPLQTPKEILHDLNDDSSVKLNNKFASASRKNAAAMDAMNEEILKNQNVADFVEIKVTTENQMNAIFSQ